MAKAQVIATEKYQKVNVRRYVIKLNRKTDADLIAYLEGKRPQTVFKEALRLLMKKEAGV